MTARSHHAAPGPSTGVRTSRRRLRGSAAVLGTLVAVQLFSGPASAQTRGARPRPISTRPASASASSDQLVQLIPTLTGEGTSADRKQAALLILQLGSDEAVKSLAGILALKNNNAAKLAICEAVADIDSPPTDLAEPLLALLTQQKEQQIHGAAVAALYRFSSAAVARKLRLVLEQEELQWLRMENAARSRELYNLLPKETDRIARLLTWLKAAQPLDRLTALEIVHSAMLATTPTPPAKEVLQQIRQMLRDPDERVRRKLVMVLCDLQEKEDAGRILAMLEHERSPLVLEEIYKALGRMGSPESIAPCIEGLQNPSPSVAGGAAEALGRLCRKVNGKSGMETSDAVAALLEKASGPLDDPGLRGQLIAAMADIADARFLPILIEHAKPAEKLPQIRQAAVTGIGRIGDPAQLDLIVAELSADLDVGVREAAAEALGKLGSKATHLRPLAVCLAEAPATVQSRAWEAYRRIFGRLPWSERLQIAATWAGKDKSIIARRIDLLSDLESQAATTKSEPAQVLNVREDLGDALVAAMDYGLAAGAYTRALEGLTTEQAGRRIPLTCKLMDAYLRMPSYDKAVILVGGVQSPQMRDALAGRILAHVQELGKVDGRSAIECLDRFKRSAPSLFRTEWGGKFEAIRRSATQPASTQPEK